MASEMNLLTAGIVDCLAKRPVISNYNWKYQAVYKCRAVTASWSFSISREHLLYSREPTLCCYLIRIHNSSCISYCDVHSPGLAAHHSSQYDPSSLIHIQNAAPLAAANVGSSGTMSSTSGRWSVPSCHRMSSVFSLPLVARTFGMLLTTSCRTSVKSGSVAASPATSTRNGRSECTR